MGTKGIAALAAISVMCLLPRVASTTEARATLTFNTYVAVAGSIDVKAVPVERPRRVVGQTLEGLSRCATLALICNGPPSMRVAVHANGDAMLDSDPALTSQTIDLCAPQTNTPGSGLLLCNSADFLTPNILGVTVDY